MEREPHNKSAYLSDELMNRRPTPSLVPAPPDNSEYVWDEKYAHSTVNPAEINNQSAGASEDTKMPDENH